MLKVSVLYGHPTDAAAFEKYYNTTHMPLAQKMPGVQRVEIARCLPQPDGSAPAFYRIAELWFDSPEALQTCMESAETKAAVGDLKNFATGGVTLVTSAID